jgi:hypothetical protein
MKIYDLIALDTDRHHAAYVDDPSGLAAYIIQDDDPIPPDEFAEELQEDMQRLYDNGDVYAVIIVDDRNDTLDSLWGIYDNDYGAYETTSYTRQTARQLLADAVSQFTTTGGYVTI